MMLRNIPNKYTREMLGEAVEPGLGGTVRCPEKTSTSSQCGAPYKLGINGDMGPPINGRKMLKIDNVGC